MSLCTVTGTIEGFPRQVRWRDGTLEAPTGPDELALGLVAAVIARGDEVTLAGLYHGPPGLGDHGQALATITSVFDSGWASTGDAPRWEAVPNDAVA